MLVWVAPWIILDFHGHCHSFKNEKINHHQQFFNWFQNEFYVRTKSNEIENKTKFENAEFKMMHHRSYRTRVVLKSCPIDYSEKFTQTQKFASSNTSGGFPILLVAKFAQYLFKSKHFRSIATLEGGVLNSVLKKMKNNNNKYSNAPVVHNKMKIHCLKW